MTNTIYKLTALGASCNLGVAGETIPPDHPELAYYIAHGYVHQVTEVVEPLKVETAAMANSANVREVAIKDVEEVDDVEG